MLANRKKLTLQVFIRKVMIRKLKGNLINFAYIYFNYQLSEKNKQTRLAIVSVISLSK
jgi:hypothetical protein